MEIVKGVVYLTENQWVSYALNHEHMSEVDSKAKWQRMLADPKIIPEKDDENRLTMPIKLPKVVNSIQGAMQGVKIHGVSDINSADYGNAIQVIKGKLVELGLGDVAETLNIAYIGAKAAGVVAEDDISKKKERGGLNEQALEVHTAVQAILSGEKAAENDEDDGWHIGITEAQNYTLKEIHRLVGQEYEKKKQ